MILCAFTDDMECYCVHLELIGVLLCAFRADWLVTVCI